MAKYLRSELNNLDPNGYSMGYGGVKDIILTQPHQAFTERFIAFGLTQIQSNPTVAQDQLVTLNKRLKDALPYLTEPSYDRFASFDPVKRLNAWSGHFIRARGLHTLEERTSGDDIESVEIALGLQQIMFKDWDVYKVKAPNNHRVVLARNLPDSDNVLIINPTYKDPLAGPFGDEFVVNSDLFHNYYTPAKFSHISEEKMNAKREVQEKFKHGSIL